MASGEDKAQVGEGVGSEGEGDSPDQGMRASGVGGEGDGVGGEGEGDSPDLATQVGRRASGARARAARTQDDRGRGVTSGEGECEGVGRGRVRGRRARIGTVRDFFL